MTRIFKILFPLLLALVLIWGVTTLGKMVSSGGSYVPFTLYSEVVQDFASLDNSGSEGTQYYDYSGHQYTDSEFDSILPSFYFRQLVMDGRLPDTLLGRAIDAKMLERESFVFVSFPSVHNSHFTPLYFLIESMSKRVDLEMPSDVFRFTDHGIEFVDMESNTIDHQKSQLFQSVFDAKGVAFPIQLVAGNATLRKPYDNGHLLLDANNHLFQLKRVVGQPFLKPIPLPDGVVPTQLFVTEYPAKKYLGFVADRDGGFYAITLPDYQLQKAELPQVDMRKDKMVIFGNPFYWTVSQTNSKGTQYTALDAHTLQAVKSRYFAKEEEPTFAYYCLPFQISVTKAETDSFVPYCHSFSPIGLVVWLLGIGAWILVSVRRRKALPKSK